MKRATMMAAALAGLAGLALAGCAGAKGKTSQYDLGVYLKQQGKADDAVEAFKRSVAIDPADPTPHEALAQMYFERGWRAQAVQAWEKVMETSSEDPAWYVKETGPKRSSAWIADGIESRKRAVEALVKIYLAEGEEATKGARWNDAAAAYKRVTELSKDSTVAWPGWAKAAKKLKDADTAYLAWKRSAELLPKEADISKELGYAAYGLKKLNEAEAAFRRYTALKPDDPKGYNNQGTVLAELGKFDESHAAFDRALQLEKDMLPALNGKGTAYYNQKRYDEARKMWAHVLDLSPDDPVAKENIRTLVKMGY
jgi:superkiller protein 3